MRRGGERAAHLLPLFTLLFRRNQLPHARCHAVQPDARPWRNSTPLLPIIEFP